MVSTNQSTVSVCIWTNERSPLRHLWCLEGVLWSVSQDLHPGLPSETFLEVEVDGIIRADLPHPVGTPTQSEGVAGRVLLTHSGEV